MTGIAMQPSIGAQRGAATLMITTILLFSMTLITLYSAQVSITGQRISANDYRAQQAFEAAQAGLEAAIGGLSPRTLANAAPAADGQLRVAAGQGTLTSGDSYTTTVSSVDPGNPRLLRVTATGSSADGSASRVVSQIVQVQPLLANAPPAPVVAGGTIQFGGSVDVTNQTNGIAAWAGGAINCRGNAVRYTLGGDPPCANGLCGGDGRLAELAANGKFFENFFGMSLDELSVPQTQTDAALCDSLRGGERVLRYTGTLRLNNGMPCGPQFGSVAEPLLLIVEGDLDFGGNVQFYGLIYVTGEVGLSPGAGNSRVHGAVVTPGDITLNGSPNPTYNPDIMQNLQNDPNNAQRMRVAGSWMDFGP